MSSPLVDEPLLKMLENEAQAASKLLTRLRRAYGLADNRKANPDETPGDSPLPRIKRLRKQLLDAQASAQDFLSSDHTRDTAESRD